MFGSKKVTSVASSLYNLAGEYEDRPNYLKTLLVNNSLKPGGFTNALQNSFLNGPKNNYYNYAAWSLNNYPESMPLASKSSAKQVSRTVLEPHLTVPAGRVPFIATIDVVKMDAYYWAEKHLIDTDKMPTDRVYTAAFNTAMTQITITIPGEPTIILSGSGFNPNDQAILASYRTYLISGIGARVDGVLLPETEIYPTPVPKVDYTPTGTASAVISADLKQYTRTWIIYPNGTQTEYTISNESIVETVNFTEVTTTWEYWRDVTITGETHVHTAHWDEVHERSVPGIELNILSTTDVIISGPPTARVIQRTQVVREVLGLPRYRNQVQQFTRSLPTGSELQTYTYRVGDGIGSLDSLFDQTTISDRFFPVVPIRIDNQFVDAPGYAAIFPDIKKSYKKYSNGQKIEDLIEILADNDKLGDLDFIYLTFGVPLNTRSREGKRYLYEFFNYMIVDSVYTKEDFARAIMSYISGTNAAVNSAGHATEFTNWLMSQGKSTQGTGLTALNRHTEYQMRIQKVTGFYNVNLLWSYIHKTYTPGLFDVDAKVGDTRIRSSTNIKTSYRYTIGSGDRAREATATNEYPRFYIDMQESESSYVTLEIVGAMYQNTIYNSQSVLVYADDALATTDEESGFLVPLLYTALRNMPGIQANQVSTESSYLLINSYKVTKIKWYQRGIFKIVIGAIVTLVAGLLIPGGWAAGSGLLGSNIAVGTALGASIGSAAVIGAIANAFAAAIFSQVLSTAAGAVFGEKWGQIVMAVLSLGSALTSAGAFTGTLDLNNLVQPQFLMKLTNSLSTIYTEIVKIKIGELGEEMGDIVSSYEDDMQTIKDKLFELRGSAVNFDFVSVLEAAMLRVEPRDMFLGRTTLTASEMRTLSLDLISDFAEINLTLPDATS